MPRYKRTFDEAELGTPSTPAVQPEHEDKLNELRNMWEFASLMQYIFLFGSVVKIGDDFDIEDLESECIKPQPSEKLAQIGLQMLKYVSSHRGLTLDLFNEYTRRQYVAKAPRRNPFGEDEEPLNFNDFDVFTKVKVLQQLSTWTLGNADRIRGMMPQEEDHLNWRMEPIGWDKDDRAYFVLDDDRLYRRADEPVPPPTPVQKPKAKSKGAKRPKARGTRSSKRRKIEDASDVEEEDVEAEAGAQDDTVMTNGDHTVQREEEEAGYGFTSKTWSCIAITLDDYQDFLATIFRTRDPNEKQLRKMIEENVLPIIEKRAEAQRAKQARKMREIENLAKLATAKRSSRLADKADREKQEREEREAEEKLAAERRMAHEEQERQRRIEEGHESRRLTREQRLKEREVKRILHEEELAKIEERAARGESQDPSSDAATVTDGTQRMSERQLKTQKERHKKELEQMQEDEDNWVFDCAKCGVHGENLDDGSHSIACERCNVWQHSKCHGFSPKQAEKDGFHFVCGTCKRKERKEKAEKEERERPKIPPLKLSKKASASPEVQIPRRNPMPNGQSSGRTNGLPDHIARQLDAPQQQQFHYYHPSGAGSGPFGPQLSNGPSLSPYGQTQGPPGYRYPPVGNFAPQPPQKPWQGSPLPPPPRPSSSGYANSPPPPMANGYGNASPSGQHQQQHQYMHQNALASAGAHPRFPAPLYNYPRSTQGGMYPPPSSSPPNQQQHHQYQLPPSPYGTHQQQGSPYQNAAHQVVNGASSPVKNVAPKPVSTSPSPHPQAPQYNFSRQPEPLSSASQPPQQYTNQGFARSPSANFPPPMPNAYPQQGAHSPVKSSPTPVQASMQQPQQAHASAAPPRLVPSPQGGYRPPVAHGAESSSAQDSAQRTTSFPGMTLSINADGSAMSATPRSNTNGTTMAADGMSGPWPEGSKAIPQKHTQALVAPSPTQALKEPPVPSVAPTTNFMTPQHPQQPPKASPAPPSANANGVAAEGMAGPWPEGSRDIPHKRDAAGVESNSPKPSGSVAASPAVAPPKLAPSPSLRSNAFGTASEGAGESGVGTIPVKKMPELAAQTPLAAPEAQIEDGGKAAIFNGPDLLPVADATASTVDKKDAASATNGINISADQNASSGQRRTE